MLGWCVGLAVCEIYSDSVASFNVLLLRAFQQHWVFLSIFIFSYFYAEIQLYKCLLGIFFEDRTITQSKNHCSLEKKQTQKLNTKSKLSSPVQQQQKYIIFYFLHKGVSPGQSQYHDETPQQRVLAFSAAITSLASGETTVQQVI